MPPHRMIGGILFLSCLFVCRLLTLTFAITFKLQEIETSYLACIIHKWHPFKWHIDFDLEAKNSFLDFVAAGGIP